MNMHEQMNPDPTAKAAQTMPLSCVERVVVVTGDGRRFDLGRPDSRLFKLRRAVYLWKRRKEFKQCR